jgi:hypothetical protein
VIRGQGNKRSGLVALAVAAGLLAVGPAQAARPLSTGVASVNDPGECEQGLGRQRLRGGERGWLVGGELECGVFEDWQLSLAYGRGRLGPARVEEAEFGAKGFLWRGAGQDAPRLALAAEISGGQEGAEAWKHEASEVELIGLLPLPAVLLHANLGHVRPRNGGLKATTWALAVEARPLSWAGLGWTPLAEVLGTDRDGRFTRWGLRVTLVPKKLHLDVSRGREHGSEPGRLWELGLRVEF